MARMPRMEVRAPAKIPIRVVLLDGPETAETIVAEDVSRHGARALATMPWHRGDRVLAKSVKGNFQAHGRVVYCEPFEGSPGRFAVGLEFFLLSGTLEE